MAAGRMRVRHPLIAVVLVAGIVLTIANLLLLYYVGITYNNPLNTRTCVSELRSHQENIQLLESEVQVLRFKLKNAWEKTAGSRIGNEAESKIGNGMTGDEVGIGGITLKQDKSEKLNSENLYSNEGREGKGEGLVTDAIYMITPTYARWTQKADLTRLCQTLMHVQNLYWIVVEDSNVKTKLVTNFLNRCHVKSIHLNVKTSDELKLKDGQPRWQRNRGVEQRNCALQWLRDTLVVGQRKAVVYFGDDDNTYDLDLFEEMRHTVKLSVWPVGICGGLRWEGPICKDGHVIDWHTSWDKSRPFPIDFAGFSVHIDLILKHSNVNIDTNSMRGRLESDFLTQLVTDSTEAEGRANDCMKVLVWHTRTEQPKTKDEEKLIAQGNPSNPEIET